MPRAFLVLLPLCIASTAQAQQARAFDPLPGGGQAYSVDNAHSLLDFTVRLVGFNRVRGSFADWSVDLIYDPAAPASSVVAFVADASSIQTGVTERDADLKGASFFDVTRFNRLRFHSTGVTPNGTVFVVEGPLTIRDSTHVIRFPVAVLDTLGRDPFGNWRVSFGASITINRRDFGVIGPAFWNNAIGDSVTIEMELGARVWDYFTLGFNSRPARRSLGEMLYQAADSDRLTQGLERARAMYARAPDSVNAGAFEFEKAAMRRAEEHHLDDARRILEFARATLTTASGPQRGEVLARLGEIYLRLGRRSDAAGALLEAIAADSDNTLAKVLQARAG